MAGGIAAGYDSEPLEPDLNLIVLLLSRWNKSHGGVHA